MSVEGNILKFKVKNNNNGLENYISVSLCIENTGTGLILVNLNIHIGTGIARIYRIGSYNRTCNLIMADLTNTL